MVFPAKWTTGSGGGWLDELSASVETGQKQSRALGWGWATGSEEAEP